MNGTATRITGWVLSGLIAALLCLPSAGSKLLEWEGKAEQFAGIGFTTDVMFGIGIVEVVSAVLFLVPRTGFVGAILLTGYLGGATCAHVRIEEPFAVSVVLGVLVWVAYGLRVPDVFRLAFGVAERPEPSAE